MILEYYHDKPDPLPYFQKIKNEFSQKICEEL